MKAWVQIPRNRVKMAHISNSTPEGGGMQRPADPWAQGPAILADLASLKFSERPCLRVKWNRIKTPGVTSGLHMCTQTYMLLLQLVFLLCLWVNAVHKPLEKERTYLVCTAVVEEVRAGIQERTLAETMKEHRLLACSRGSSSARFCIQPRTTCVETVLPLCWVDDKN